MYIFNIIYILTDTYNNAVNQNKLSIRKITTTLKCTCHNGKTNHVKYARCTLIQQLHKMKFVTLTQHRTPIMVIQIPMKLINLIPRSMWIYAAYSSFNHRTVLPRHHTQTTITPLFQFVYKHDMHLQRISV